MALRGHSGLEVQILDVFWNSIKKNKKYFYQIFIDILIIQKKYFSKLQAGKLGGKKRVCPGWHDSNPSSHLEQKKKIFNQ